jgi:hypothetical protein
LVSDKRGGGGAEEIRVARNGITGTPEMGEGTDWPKPSENRIAVRIAGTRVEGITAIGTNTDGVASIAVAEMISQTKSLKARANAQRPETGRSRACDRVDAVTDVALATPGEQARGGACRAVRVGCRDGKAPESRDQDEYAHVESVIAAYQRNHWRTPFHGSISRSTLGMSPGESPLGCIDSETTDEASGCSNGSGLR